MLSKKAQYALKALSELVTNNSKTPVLIKDIAEKKGIPLKFLENILLELKKAGILDSKKGKNGGYFLREAPEKTTLAQIVRLMDGPIALLPCVSLYFYERCSDCDEQNCDIHRIFAEVRDRTLEVLENTTLRDIHQKRLSHSPNLVNYE